MLLCLTILKVAMLPPFFQAGQSNHDTTFLLVRRRAKCLCYFARWVRVAIFQLYAWHVSEQPYSTVLPAGSEQPAPAVVPLSSYIYIYLRFMPHASVDAQMYGKRSHWYRWLTNLLKMYGRVDQSLTFL